MDKRKAVESYIDNLCEVSDEFTFALYAMFYLDLNQFEDSIRNLERDQLKALLKIGQTFRELRGY